MKLKAHFGKSKNEDSTQTEQKQFYIKSKSNWTPRDSHHTVNTFAEALQREIIQQN